MKPQDQDIINIKIKEIEYSVELIRSRIPQTFEEFLKLDELVRDGIYKRVEFIIQNILDILAIFTKYLKTIPGDDDEIIEILIRANLIDEETGKKIRQMKAFRNLLVHRYGKIFHELAYKNIIEGFGDIYNVLEMIRKIRDKLDP